MKSTLGFLFLFFSIHLSWGQITIQNTLTPEEIVQNVLLGTGVTVSNIQWNGSAVDATTIKTSLGEFGGTPNIGIPNGVILSCGNIMEAVGPNAQASSGDNTGVDDYSADPDLQGLQPAGVAIHDAGVIEFDFIPSGDSISFQYVFSSEEYPEYAPPNNSGFNDAFGFFLSGPNPAGGNYVAQNIATLPGGSPVSINNVNPVTNTPFYVDNTGGANIEYDGYTIPLTAEASVTCGETYHIKLGISDAGDRALNSAVFLEANSFSSNAIQVSIVTQTGDTSIIEGCAGADIHFIRPENDTIDSLIVNFDITGTATNGTDYTQINTPITFLPGEDSVTINFNPIADGNPESSESVIITVYTLNPCGDTITSVGTLWIIEPEAEVTVNSETLPCPNNSGVWLVATPVSGILPYNFVWDDGTNNDSLFVSTNTVGINNYTITMTDQCGEAATAVSTVTVQSFEPASFTASPITGTAPLVVNYTNTSTAGDTFDWTFGDGQSDQTNTPSNVSNTFNDIGNYTTVLTVTSNEGCVDTANQLITVYNLPSISAPNVFTPDGDGINDFYQFTDYENIANFSCLITNRWGSEIIQLDDITESWDGMINGKQASEGTYFYMYTGSSSSGHEVSGHGFFHLNRKK
ncbi:MAG: choice-of-anchor L domain-containing protein [Crocinitomicaceae bacterium]|nr:choice-of-anchor L domain-containing protein [Crocinitomicaceae bacterium]